MKFIANDTKCIFARDLFHLSGLYKTNTDQMLPFLCWGTGYHTAKIKKNEKQN